MTRTYEEMKSDALQVIRALRGLGWSRDKIRQTVRFKATEEEVEALFAHWESRQTVSAGTGHIAYAGQKVGFFGIPIVTEQGEIKNHLF